MSKQLKYFIFTFDMVKKKASFVQIKFRASKKSGHVLSSFSLVDLESTIWLFCSVSVYKVIKKNNWINNCTKDTVAIIWKISTGAKTSWRLKPQTLFCLQQTQRDFWKKKSLGKLKIDHLLSKQHNNVSNIWKKHLSLRSATFFRQLLHLFRP